MDTIRIFRKDNLSPKHKNEHEPFEYRRYPAVERADGLNCIVAFYEIPPLKANFPTHYHAGNTEVFLIQSGAGLLRTSDGERPIRAGDLIVCPPGAGGTHRLTNTSDTEPLAYLDFDTAALPEVVCYPDSRKIAFLDNASNAAIFRQESEVDYYDGE